MKSSGTSWYMTSVKIVFELITVVVENENRPVGAR